MKLQTTFAIGALVAAAALAACGGDDTTGGTGGSAGSAGAGTGGGTGGGGTGGSGTGGGGTTNTGGGTGTGGSITDASEASSSCTTTPPAGAELLFSFDTGSDAATIAGWHSYIGSDPADAGLSSSVQIGLSGTEGKSCPGALSFTVPFTAYGQLADVQILLPTPRDWTGKTTAHFAIKVQAPDGGTIGYLNGAQAYVQSGETVDGSINSYAHYVGQFTNASVLADGLFHEVSVALRPATGDMTNLSLVTQVGVQLTPYSLTNLPDAGVPASPGTTTLFVDDIWAQ